MAKTPDVSICIATFRRPCGLVRLLESLSRLKLPDGVRTEIVVVDNDASGLAQSRAAAAGHIARSVRFFVEPRQNIAHARNRAVREARGRWIAFIDDDEVADERWLAAFWRQIESEEADGFFGPVLPRLEAAGAAWLDVTRFFPTPRRPSGAAVRSGEAYTNNACVRRSLFADCEFDPAWGRTGGSDTELFDRMLAAGASFLWCDEAQVEEIVPPQRHRLAWLTQRAFRGGVGFTRLQRERGRPGALSRGLPRAVLAFGAFALLLPFSLLGGRVAAARVWLRLCVQAGHLWAFTGGSYEEYRASRAHAADAAAS